MKQTTLCLLLCHMLLFSTAQVATVTGGRPVTASGYFGAAHNMRQITLPPFHYQLPTTASNALPNEGVYKFAEPVTANINLLTGGRPKLVRNRLVYAVKIRVPNALSVSVNFNKFYLPQGAEMYLYNPSGTEVTGPVTSKENNADNLWGSDVYEGDAVIIEVAIPVAAALGRPPLLNINRINCGFRSLRPQSSEAGRFGASGACNINVSCPEGIGWDLQKRSVALILDPYGGSFTGVLLNNTCNNRVPYILTAAHAALNSETQPISKWRFVFNYWSKSCNPSEDGSQRLLFNGATLKAYSTWTDFALLQMNQVPDPSSSIVYAGWNRNSTNSNTGMGLHHPAGDVMKLAYDSEPLIRTNYPGLTGVAYWQTDWNIGVTETGSSGSPLFDSKGRVIGQLKGGYSFCGSSQKKDYYGCFDISWPGSGTPSSRLQDWLDPIGTGAMTTNPIASDYYSIAGPAQVCATGTYTITNLPADASVTWSQPSPSGIATLSESGHAVTLTHVTDGVVTLTATITLCGHTFTITTNNIQMGAYPMEIVAAQTSCSDVVFTATGNAPVASYNWSVSTGDLILDGVGSTAVTSVPYVMASGTYGTIALTTANYCGAASVIYADYLPYRRDFIYGMYQPILNGESLIASIPPVSYVKEYRWYLNGQLVQEGNSLTYGTTSFNLVCGENELKVIGVTDCGETEIAYDNSVVKACGGGFGFRNELSAVVYPNPASDQVRVELKTADGKMMQSQTMQRVNVYDKLGLLKKQLLVKGMQQSVMVPVYDLPEGIYFIELISNKQTIKQTLVIKR